MRPLGRETKRAAECSFTFDSRMWTSRLSKLSSAHAAQRAGRPAARRGPPTVAEAPKCNARLYQRSIGAFYRRMRARVGKAKTITATARKLALLVYRMLQGKIQYQEMSAADYDRQQRSRILRGLRRRAASLGLELVDTSTGLVM